MLIVIVAAAGCQGPLAPIFPEVSPAVVWPGAPDAPRIRYIGELRGEASLGAPSKGLDIFGAIFTGPKPKVAFSTPMAVATRGENVYVADGQGQAVYTLNLATRQFTVLREAAGRNLEWPIDVACAGELLAVADSKRAAVFLFDASGGFIRAIGEGSLKRPSAIAFDQSGSLWVVDSAAHDCQVFDLDGRLKSRIGGRGSGSGQFNFPTGLACDGGVAIDQKGGSMTHPTTVPQVGSAGAAIADSMNFRVQLLAEDGSPLLAFGKKGDAAGDFALPRDVAFDSDGNIYALDNQFENVQVFDRQGRLLMAFGKEGRGPGEFYLPSGITIDDKDRIWIADTYNRRVQVFQYLKEARP